jgi:anti-sigma regulatory factor (Ser/Thr protein kinase)
MKTGKLILINKIRELSRIQDFLEQISDAWSLDPTMVFELNLILEEYINNLISYGYHDDIDHEIVLDLKLMDDHLELVITDDAGPFDITEVSENEDLTKPVEERRIGGLGIHFIKSLADKLDYQSEGGKNKLIIVKKLFSQ